MWTRYVWHATDIDGGRWTGVNSGPGLAIRVHRLRVCTWQTEFGNGRAPRYCHRRATHAGQGGAFDLYCRTHARQVFDLYGWITTALPPRALALSLSLFAGHMGCGVSDRRVVTVARG